MPPYFDRSQLQTAIAARALPSLELLAGQRSRLERSLDNRFERDDPPPYMSSSESEEEETLHHPVFARPEEDVLEEFKDLLSQPLSGFERKVVLRGLGDGAYTPGRRYQNEARLEYARLSSFAIRQPYWSLTKAFLKGQKGQQRRAVIVRHNIRKRWQRLGVWNPEWGIPGRVNQQPNDNVDAWKWKWQSSADPPFSDPRHPIGRALQLRDGQAYGEHAPPPPRHHLGDNASASEAESFIISRPWFTYIVEHADFMARRRRISVERLAHPDPEEDDQVAKWWKERGDWRNDWEVPGDRGVPVPGWKWRHESPSPEPEDLSLLITDGMDFSPSEIDALDAIPPPTPPPPRLDTPAPPEYAANDTSHRPAMFRSGELGDRSPPQAEAVQQDAHSKDQLGLEDQLMLDAEPEPPNPPPRRRGCPRKQAHPAQVARAPLPPPRRSARIAAIAANSAPEPSTVTTGRKANTRPGRAVPAAPPPRNTRSTAEAPKKRGRPRKAQDRGITKPAAFRNKRGRKSSGATSAAAEKAAAAALDAREKKDAPAAGKRGRGRPRKTR